MASRPTVTVVPTPAAVQVRIRAVAHETGVCFPDRKAVPVKFPGVMRVMCNQLSCSLLHSIAVLSLSSSQLINKVQNLSHCFVHVFRDLMTDLEIEQSMREPDISDDGNLVFLGDVDNSQSHRILALCGHGGRLHRGLVIA